MDELIYSYEALDITGARLAAGHDGRGLTPLTYRYNLVKAPGYQHSIDGYMLTDAGGQPLYHRDADVRKFRTLYDALRRPLEQWCDSVKLGYTVYGEGQPGDIANNLRGQVLKIYDGAGRHYVDACDFKGQPLKSYMRMLDGPARADADWSTLGNSDLDSGELFFTKVVSDALRRLCIMSGRARKKGHIFYSMPRKKQ